jgi:Raf kinase inhibitor-like YbhB/YbcL family protein
MRILELIGKSLRSIRSEESKLTENSPEVSSHPKSIKVSSVVFKDGEAIPPDYATGGSRVFPTISWTDVPADCKSLVLVVEDPDAPKPTPFVHGIFYNIPANLQEIKESDVLKDGIAIELSNLGVRMGTNTLSKAAYMPPAPPPGHGPHHYHFQLIALDNVLSFSNEPTLADLKKEIENHTLAYGELTGIFER